MSSDIAICAEGLSKCYPIYSKPSDRLLQMMSPRGHRRYREFWALKDVSFEMKKGEAIGIIGRNGSGKSTLLQLLCGTLGPTSGVLQVQGRVAALLELGAGFNPEFTGRENVYMAASLYGLSGEDIDLRFSAIAAFADIGGFMEQPVKTYSSGMYVRLAFAVIAHVDADILVIDEALSVGDAYFSQKCMRFIRQFKQEHSLIFVSHDTAAVINLCDRVIWLDRGQEKLTGPSRSVCESYLNDLFHSMNEVQEEPVVVHGNGHKSTIRRHGHDGLEWRDQRADAINSSSLRNDLEVFRFDPQAPGDFGGEEARIVNVRLNDSAGVGLTWVLGGERVTLRVEAQAHVPVARPIIGFFVKDRLGQTLFGDNTYISQMGKECAAPAGAMLAAEFEFFMPWLAKGDYVIQVAIADGEQNDHKQLHWCHEGLLIRSHHDPVSTGIIGIPFLNISLSVDRY
ncbi:ABC transporter ATP-binding protein [Pseudomonas gingeri]|uniref:ABC transporter ATP-binding protein n=1 Tax=Pseudomonas gingeri TaxID=117681 RepID=UPI0015A13A43|nr:ABC transporter ATP-binding protein [Pseudomonas gingeri]NVZ62047.1 ABC transporter ATP-binding protein [Pseudomonas gingeri]NVZ78215.1 ABC transporter ATP-binding protein [Pseudomonas gingeri]